MYVCMYVCACVYVCMYVCMFAYKECVYICMHVYMHGCVYVCVIILFASRIRILHQHTLLFCHRFSISDDNQPLKKLYLVLKVCCHKNINKLQS